MALRTPSLPAVIGTGPLSAPAPALPLCAGIPRTLFHPQIAPWVTLTVPRMPQTVLTSSRTQYPADTGVLS